MPSPPPCRASVKVASALNDVTRGVGTALGVSLLAAVLTAGYRGAIDSRLDGVPDAVADTAREGVANALAAADGVGPQAQALIRAARESFVGGWRQAMWAGAVVMAGLFVYVLAQGPQQRTQGSGGDSRESGDVVADLR